MDLADLLIRAIDERREELNASRIARGEAGRIEIQVNLTVNRVDLVVMVRDQQAA